MIANLADISPLIDFCTRNFEAISRFRAGNYINVQDDDIVVSESETGNSSNWQSVSEKISELNNNVEKIIENEAANSKSILHGRKISQFVGKLSAAKTAIERFYTSFEKQSEGQDKNEHQLILAKKFDEQASLIEGYVRRLEEKLLNLSDKIALILQQEFNGRILTNSEIHNLALAISIKFQEILQNDSNPGKLQRFRKGDKAKATFWIVFDPEKKVVVVDIIVPVKEIIGKGSYRKIKKGLSLNIPIEKDINGDFFISQRSLAIVRPLCKENSRLRVLKTEKTHCEVFNQVGDNKGVFVSQVCDIRTYTSRGKEEKIEMIQILYPSVLSEIHKTPCIDIGNGKVINIGMKECLKFLKEMFSTLAALHELGHVHRDVKPQNILLGIDENNQVHAYLHDFDLLSKTLFQFLNDEYVVWDIAGQNGFVTPMSDIVGGLIIALIIIFSSNKTLSLGIQNAKIKNVCFEQSIVQGLDLVNIENQFSIDLKGCKNIKKVLETIEKSKSPNSSIEIKRNISVLDKIACMIQKVIRQEDAVYAKLLASFICYFTGLDRDQFNKLLAEEKIEEFKSAIMKSKKMFIEKRIIDPDYFDNNGVSLKKYLENQKINIDYYYSVYTAVWDLAESNNSQYSDNTIMNLKMLGVFMDVITNNSNYFIDILNQPDAKLASPDPEMIANLESTDSKKRKRGIEKISQEFTTARELAEFFADLEKEFP